MTFTINNTINICNFDVSVNNSNTNTKVYRIVDQNLSQVSINNYQNGVTSFHQYLQNFKHKGETYENVLVLKSEIENIIEYIVIKPSFEVLYIEYNHSTYKLAY